MLVYFSVTNFKTFKEAFFSLEARKYSKDNQEAAVHSVDELNTSLLKSAAILGANSSGKSKFIEALLCMNQIVLARAEETEKKIALAPFKLHTDTKNSPTEFEVTFIYEKELFRYGFAIKQDTIVEEWLYRRPKTKEVEVFYRQDQKFKVHARSFSKSKRLVKNGLIRENALLLTIAAQFNEQLAAKVLSWFSKLQILFQAETLANLPRHSDKQAQQRLVSFLQAADIDIKTVGLTDSSKTDSVEKSRLSSLFVTHRCSDASNQPVANAFFCMEEESLGTKKLAVLAEVLLATLEQGNILVIDDLDAYLHSNLVTKIVSLFHSKVLNPNYAQLIFTTHASSLLRADLLRKDQIYFAEKDAYGAAQLFRLAQFINERKKAGFEHRYLQGYYGAIPSLSQFEHIIATQVAQKQK